MRIALFEPEIPSNTGNIIRLCSALPCDLDVIYPLGFDFEDKKLRRAGLDYHDLTRVFHHDNFEQFRHSLQPGSRIIALSTKGSSLLWDFSFCIDDCLLFGPESRGLPEAIRHQADYVIKIPMAPQARSLNLSNAVAIVAYEALRQYKSSLEPNVEQ
jgi:tRNA (cytidine/uridine-2'-O-)-methyltransferase